MERWTIVEATEADKDAVTSLIEKARMSTAGLMKDGSYCKICCEEAFRLYL